MPKLMWSYRPYVPFRKRGENRPFVCAIRPFEKGFECDFLEDAAVLRYRCRFTDKWESAPLCGKSARLENLLDRVDYEFYIETADGRRSITRLVRTGATVGPVINYLHPDDRAFAFSGQYPCSPSILRLESGRLLASYDIYAKEGPQCLNTVFASDDDGKTWRYLCDLFPSFWGKLFTLNGRLYMLSCSQEYGDLLIGESKDGGETWCTPTVIERGPGRGKAGFHRAPCVYAIAGGRIWFAVENGAWADGLFDDLLVSAPVDADLLDPESWTFTAPRKFDPAWCGGRAIVSEGNVFEKDGVPYVLYRDRENVAVLMKADPARPEKALEFVQKVDCPFAHTKFEIVRGDDGVFYAAGNELTPEGKAARNVLSMFKSRDGREWEKIKTVVGNFGYDPAFIGFQYPVFLLEGRTVTLISRTAWNGAASFHDSNMMTFHRFEL